MVEPLCKAAVDAHGHVVIELLPAGDAASSEGRASEEEGETTGLTAAAASVSVDPIWLSVFSHRFMGVAEQVPSSVYYRLTIPNNPSSNPNLIPNPRYDET